MPALPGSVQAPPHIAIARKRRSFRWLRGLLVAALGLLALGWAGGLTPAKAWTWARTWVHGNQVLPALLVDRGDVSVYVVESGSLESANNTAIKCEVEALLGVVGGTTQGGKMAGGVTATAAGAATGGAAPTTVSSASPVNSTTTAAAAAAPAQNSAAATAAAQAAATAQAAALTGNTLLIPGIESFTYVVTPYIPLRAAATTTKVSVVASGGAQGGGGGGGGGRGGGGGGGGQQGMSDAERAGATRILSILDEGTEVKAGDVVCRLDSSAFEDELQVQQIRYAQAKSFVDQAVALLEVNQITLRQYAEGILPKDRLQIQNYIDSCRTQLEKTKADLVWGREVYMKGLRSETQLKADQFSLDRADPAWRGPAHAGPPG